MNFSYLAAIAFLALFSFLLALAFILFRKLSLKLKAVIVVAVVLVICYITVYLGDGNTLDEACPRCISSSSLDQLNNAMSDSLQDNGPEYSGLNGFCATRHFYLSLLSQQSALRDTQSLSSGQCEHAKLASQTRILAKMLARRHALYSVQRISEILECGQVYCPIRSASFYFQKYVGDKQGKARIKACQRMIDRATESRTWVNDFIKVVCTAKMFEH